MIDSYKNIERLRYRVNKDLLSIYDNIERNSEKQRIRLVDECFSAIASSFAALFFTQSTFEPLKKLLRGIYKFMFESTMPDSAVSIVTAIISIIILLFFAIIVNKLLLLIKTKKEYHKVDGVDKTDYVKEFDNIACDSVFASMEYKKLYFTTYDRDERTWYYLEAMHYLEVAIVITERLCLNPLNIKSGENVLGVDAYRIHNIKSVMEQLYDFVDLQRNNLSLSDKDKKSIQSQLKVIEDKLKIITV